MNHQEQFYRNVLDNLNEPIYFVDTNRTVTYWNSAAQRLTGFTSEEMLGQRCAEQRLKHVDNLGLCLCEGECPLLETLKDGQVRELEMSVHHKNGHRIPVFARISPIINEDGKIVGAVQAFSDNTLFTQMRERVEQLERLAMLDTLTGLPNRRYLDIVLTSRLSELRRYNLPFGIQFLDIDQFKRVNEVYGRAVGDRVLKMIGHTLSYNTRIYDTLGRWDEDGFLAVLPQVDTEHLQLVGQRFQQLIAQSFINHEDQMIHVTVSIGMALASRNDSIESLIKRAEDRLSTAMRMAHNLSQKV